MLKIDQLISRICYSQELLRRCESLIFLFNLEIISYLQFIPPHVHIETILATIIIFLTQIIIQIIILHLKLCNYEYSLWIILFIHLKLCIFFEFTFKVKCIIFSCKPLWVILFAHLKCWALVHNSFSTTIRNTYWYFWWSIILLLTDRKLWAFRHKNSASSSI